VLAAGSSELQIITASSQSFKAVTPKSQFDRTKPVHGTRGKKGRKPSRTRTERTTETLVIKVTSLQITWSGPI